MIKGIIFDLDGTLLDTATDLANAVNYTLKELNQPIRTEAEIKAFLGNGVHALMTLSLTDKTLLTKAMPIFLAYYEVHRADYTAPYPDIMNLIENLSALSLKLGIVSNKVHDAVVALNHSIFKGLLPYAFGDQVGYKRKPDADLINLCLSKMNLKSDEVLYIGDTEVDYLTAKQSNLEFVAVTWGFRTKEALQALKPRHLIDKPLELLNIVKGD